MNVYQIINFVEERIVSLEKASNACDEDHDLVGAHHYEGRIHELRLLLKAIKYPADLITQQQSKAEYTSADRR